MWWGKKNKKTPGEAPDKTKIKTNLEENIKELDAEMGIKKSFDLLTRELSIGGTKVTLLFIDGLTNDQVVTLVLQNLTRLERAEILPDALKKLFNTHLGYTELEEVQYLEDIVDKILAGPMPSWWTVRIRR